MSRATNRAAAPLLAALLLLLGGCAMVRGKITAEDARGPVSLTPHVYGPDGKILTLGEELEEVGRFKTTESFYAAFYGLLPPTWTWDASEFCNTQLDRYGGEAIVNLTATVQESGTGEALLFWYTQANPYFPIWVSVDLEGTVVKRKDAD